MDIFDTKGIKPMLIAEMKEPFNDKNYIYELKLDGIRCVAYMDKDSVDLRNKRDFKLLPRFPELKGLNKLVNEKCILDGELLVTDREGKPDFYEMQRRTTLTNNFKINLACKANPASYVVYDIIYLKDKLVNDLELIERKRLLQSVITNENSKFATSRYIEEKGIELFELSRQQSLEGVVAKKKDSKYWFNKRSKDWIKFKVMNDDDFVICGYIFKPNNMASLILAKYNKNNELQITNHVSLGVSITKLKQNGMTQSSCPLNTIPKGYNNAVWIEPMVCTVEYMPSNTEGLRQPVFKGIRVDKLPNECRIYV